MNVFMRFSGFSLCLCPLLWSCLSHDLQPSVFDCSASDLALTLVEERNATACGVADGAIIVAATGGIPPYTYFMNSRQQDHGNFENVISGVYTPFVVDSNGCTFSLPNLSVNASGFAFEAKVKTDTDCTFGNGSITIDVHEGAAPFQFKFQNGDFTEIGTFNSLKEGEYEITMKDANECSVVLKVTVPKGDTGTSWSNTIKPIVTTYCALSGCHNGITRPDLSIYDNAKSYAAQMKELTQSRSMPFEGTLAQEQIDLIACWVDEGALNN